ncbi:MAG: C40 family peptidase [Pyrinomonadaceae bacterium]
MQFKKPAILGLFVLFFASAAINQVSAQESRPRRAVETAPTSQSSKVNTSVQQYQRNAPANSVTVNSAPSSIVKNSIMQRPVTAAKSVLTNDLMVRPTVLASPAAANMSATKAISSGMAAFNQRLLQSMYLRIGIPYVYGSQGPNTYDCSGLVWSVFKEAGIDLERTSAATMWNKFEPATDEDKYKFGTLVFFNRLGHIGIVIDADTFYQASSSKGVTFSKFTGYWEKRIVGFRRVPIGQFANFIKPLPTK